MNLNICKSMAPDDTHPSVLTELTDVVAYPFSIVWEKSRQSGGVPVTGKMETSLPILKRVEKKTLGTTNQSVQRRTWGYWWMKNWA